MASGSCSEALDLIYRGSEILLSLSLYLMLMLKAKLKLTIKLIKWNFSKKIDYII